MGAASFSIDADSVIFICGLGNISAFFARLRIITVNRTPIKTTDIDIINNNFIVVTPLFSYI
ncbi:MAG: hypothetical protein ABSB19_01065 [Methylomonas sp.]